MVKTTIYNGGKQQAQVLYFDRNGSFEVIRHPIEKNNSFELLFSMGNSTGIRTFWNSQQIITITQSSFFKPFRLSIN